MVESGGMTRRAFVRVASLGVLGLAGCSNGVEDTAAGEREETSGDATAVESDAPLPIEVTSASFFNGEDGYVSYAIGLHNPNDSYFTDLVPINVKFFDENGDIVGVDDGCYSSQLYGGGDTFVCGMRNISATASTIEAAVGGSDNDYLESNTPQSKVDEMIRVENLSQVTDDFSGLPSYVGEVVNDSELTLGGCNVSIVYLDVNGDPVGGTVAYVNQSIAPGSSAVFQDSPSIVGVVPEHASVKAYANVLYLEE